MKKYNEIMEHISVTDEMRQRILTNIQNTECRKKQNILYFPKLHRYIGIAVCLTLIITSVFIFAYKQNKPELNTSLSDSQNNSVNVIPQFSEKQNIEELIEAVGFDVTEIDNLPIDIKEKKYISFGQELAEIRYIGEKQSAYYRKTNKTDNLSGDYTKYTSIFDTEFNDITFTLKGIDDKYYSATWSKDNFYYSLRFTEGLTKTELTEIIKNID